MSLSSRTPGFFRGYSEEKIIDSFTPEENKVTVGIGPDSYVINNGLNKIHKWVLFLIFSMLKSDMCPLMGEQLFLESPGS